jgi:predicted O-methyltransferase YrrM
MNHFYENLPGYFTYEDFYRWLAREVPLSAHLVEVGSFAGRSSAFLAVELHNSGNGGAHLELVDHFQNGPGAEAVRAALAPVQHIVRNSLHVSDSADAAAKFPDNWLDAVFIDADHSYAAVRRDIDAWLPKVRPGGIIAGHDYTLELPGVIQAVTETFGFVSIWRGSLFNGRYYPVWQARKE